MIYTLVHHILKFKRINSAGDLPTNVHNKFTSFPTKMNKICWTQKGQSHKQSAFENGIPFPNAFTTNLPTNVKETLL